MRSEDIKGEVTLCEKGGDYKRVLERNDDIYLLYSGLSSIYIEMFV